MPDTPNGSHESIDTSPLTLDQLSEEELVTIVSIESQLKMKHGGGSMVPGNSKPYLAPVQERRPQVLLLDGARGTGKTSLLLTMAHLWSIGGNCDAERRDHTGDQYKQRISRIQHRLQRPHDGELPEHLHPLRILDFDPLPPQMPLIAGIIQAWQPLAEKYDELSRGPVECDDEGKTLRDRWDKLFRVATVGWSPVPLAKGLLEHVLDRQEQVSEWQRLGQSWHEFVTEVIACGKCVKDPHKLHGEPVFVIMIDDVDLQVERIRELLPALRLLYHPNVAFLVAAHWEHLVDTLKLDFLGQQNRLANRLANRNVLSAADDDKWSGTLAHAAATKVFPLKNKWTLRKLTLHELLAFPNSGDDAAALEKGDASIRATMRTMLNKWPRESKGTGLGEYLHKMAGTQDDPYEIFPFITYRDVHQIYESASMQRDGRAEAVEAVRRLISDPESEAVTLGSAEGAEPIVEYRGVGQLAALFRLDQIEPTSALSGIVLSARPEFTYRKEPSSNAILMRGYVGAEVNFASAMLAATLHEARYGVAAPGLQWNVALALVWTRVEVPDEKSLLKLAFQWRFHVHPHPFQLLQWSHEWRRFVRTFQASPAERLERIAYAWIHYQLKWLNGTMDGVPSPSATEAFPGSHWGKLLAASPKRGNDKEHGSWEHGSWWSQDWQTQTLPLLARPEIGLPPNVQSQLLSLIHSDDPKVGRIRREWLKEQRRRLVTDAIIAAGEEEGRPAKDAENTERVDRIVKKLNEQYLAAHGNVSPWLKIVEKDAPHKIR